MTTKAALLASYVEAFNRRDAEAYAGYYAADVVLRNGGGTVLCGRKAIVDFYSATSLRLARTMRIRSTCEGDHALAAALASTFTALVDDVALAGEVLNKGDKLELESMALYEITEGKFCRIEATTLARTVLRYGDAT